MTNENSETLPTVAIPLKVELDRSPAPAGELPSEPALCTHRKRMLHFCYRRCIIPRQTPLHFPALWRMDSETQLGMEGVQNNQRSTDTRRPYVFQTPSPILLNTSFIFPKLKDCGENSRGNFIGIFLRHSLLLILIHEEITHVQGKLF